VGRYRNTDPVLINYIPSHDLVVARLGNFKGSRHVGPTFGKALEILMAAVPKK